MKWVQLNEGTDLKTVMKRYQAWIQNKELGYLKALENPAYKDWIAKHELKEKNKS